MHSQSWNLSWQRWTLSVWGLALGLETIVWITLSWVTLTHDLHASCKKQRADRWWSSKCLSVTVKGGNELKKQYFSHVSLLHVLLCWLILAPSLVLYFPFFTLCTLGLITHILTSCFLQINLYFRKVTWLHAPLFPQINYHRLCFSLCKGVLCIFFFFLNTFEINPNNCLVFCKHGFQNELNLLECRTF